MQTHATARRARLRLAFQIRRALKRELDTWQTSVEGTDSTVDLCQVCVHPVMYVQGVDHAPDYIYVQRAMKPPLGNAWDTEMEEQGTWTDE